MLRPIGQSRSQLSGRHRLGAPGLVHCLAYPEVERALADSRRSRLSALLMPARHSWAGLRRRPVMAGQSLSQAA
jgi:hypothetical protein